VVTLERELELLDRYLAIMDVRFEQDVRVRRVIADGIAHLQVPPLILQPLVENALQHGMGGPGAPGNIEISAMRERDTLVLAVTDDGRGAEPTEQRERPRERTGARAGMGLVLTSRRLTELYGSQSSLHVGDAPGGGTRAVIRFPALPVGAESRAHA
jgi:sensor histidine kinase YesM